MSEATGIELRPTDDLTADERRELIASMTPEDAERVPELHEVEVPDELREQIETAMARYPQVRSASIPALWAVQRHYGWCSPEGIRQAAAVMGLTPAYLQSVASFYDLFHTEPDGPPPGARLPQHLLLDERRRRAARRVLRGRRRRPRRGRRTAAPAPPTASSTSRASSASAPATWRRWPRSTRSTSARSSSPTPGGDRAAALGRRGAAGQGARQAARPPAARSPSRDPRVAEVEAMAEETRMLFRNVDEPGLALDRGLPAAAAATRRSSAPSASSTPRSCSSELEDSGLRGRGGAGFSMGKKAGFLPRGDMEKYLCCNADESEPGTFKDRELMQKNPHQLIEGCLIASARGRRRATRSSSSAASTGRSPTCSTRAVAEAYDAGFAGENILGTGVGDRHRRPPRRRRLHLRRGDGAARLARGQARQPAAEAAVPGDPGPLRRADADQQRRDARRTSRTSSTTAPTGSRASAPSSRRGPRSSRSRAASSGPATTRSSWGSRRARSSRGSRAARPTGARSRPGSRAAPRRRC